MTELQKKKILARNTSIHGDFMKIILQCIKYEDVLTAIKVNCEYFVILPIINELLIFNSYFQ